MHILLIGASGFIGKHLVKYLTQEGHEVTGSGRKSFCPTSLSNHCKNWIQFEKISPTDLQGFDAIIHLSGAPIIGWRWTKKYKQKLESSRIETTKHLANLLLKCPSPPNVWIQASAIGFYPSQGGPYEETSSPGKEYLCRLCQKWESASQAILSHPSHIRRVLLRIGIVLSSDGGALSSMLPAFRLGLGGPIGKGDQIQSWIHIKDLCRLVQHLLNDTTAHGPFNATSPSPVSQKEMALALAKKLARPCVLPLPKFILKLLLGEAACLLTEGSSVLPQKALKHGFQFNFRDISKTFDDLL